MQYLKDDLAVLDRLHGARGERAAVGRAADAEDDVLRIIIIIIITTTTTTTTTIIYKHTST
jgi:hypothetical protein